MTEFAGYFLRVEKIGFCRGAMSVVAHAAALEHAGIVSVDLAKIIALVAIETAAFENKTAARAHTVAPGTLDTGKRRVLVKGLKPRGRIWAHEEVHFPFASVPLEYE